MITTFIFEVGLPGRSKRARNTMKAGVVTSRKSDAYDDARKQIQDAYKDWRKITLTPVKPDQVVVIRA